MTEEDTDKAQVPPEQKVTDKAQVPPEQELQAVTTLYSAEIGANVSELQVTTNLAVALLAFLGVVGYAFDKIGPVALILSPAVVLLVCTYLLIRVAVVIRRASLARAYEVRISKLGGFSTAVGKGTLGSTFYGSVDDIQVIREEEPGNWAAKGSKYVRFIFASVAAGGAYIISIGFTIAVVVNAWTRSAKNAAPSPVIWAATILYPVGWALFIIAAILLVVKGFTPAGQQNPADPSAP